MTMSVTKISKPQILYLYHQIRKKKLKIQYLGYRQALQVTNYLLKDPLE